MATEQNPHESDPVVDEYSRIAGSYDEKWSFYVTATTRETMSRLPVRGVERILDVGCGTGALLHALARAFPDARVSGVDLVPEMLDVARRRLPASAELELGSAEKLPWADGEFDVVVSCNVFHYIRNPLIALREMARVLRPGGRLVITDWCHDYFACRMVDLYLRFFDRAHFRSYGQRECLDLLRESGHPRAEIERYKINWLWGLMTATASKDAA